MQVALGNGGRVKFGFQHIEQQGSALPAIRQRGNYAHNEYIGLLCPFGKGLLHCSISAVKTLIPRN
jgi:hypothetical protein